MASSEETNDIIRFFTQQPSPVPTLKTVLLWSNDRLEIKHDYIQLLFPLPEASMFRSAPLVTAQVFAAFRASDARGDELRVNLRKAFNRMVAFYGFEVSDDGTGEEGNRTAVNLKWAADHSARFHNWVRRFNHNHLRLTRIIRSLRVLGLEDEAAALHSALEELARTKDGRAISPQSRVYWERAATRALYLAPDDDANRRGVQKFLKKFEDERSKAKEEEDRAAGVVVEAGSGKDGKVDSDEDGKVGLEVEAGGSMKDGGN